MEELTVIQQLIINFRELGYSEDFIESAFVPYLKPEREQIEVAYHAGEHFIFNDAKDYFNSNYNQ